MTSSNEPLLRFTVSLPRYEFEEFIKDGWRLNSIQTTVNLAVRNSTGAPTKTWKLEMERTHERFFHNTKLLPIKRWAASNYQACSHYRVLFDELTPYNYLRLYYTALVLQRLEHFSQKKPPDAHDVWIENVTATFRDRLTITR